MRRLILALLLWGLFGCAPVFGQLRPGAFTTLTVTDTGVTALKVGCAVGAAPPCTGTVTAGPIVGSQVTVNSVGIISTAGQIPAISSTYFASLSAANLTGIPAGQLSGTITSATQDLITRTGTVTSGTWGGAFSDAALTAIDAGTWTGATSITTLGTVATGTWNASFSDAALTAIDAGTWTGATSLTTLGTITSGIWNAGAVTSSAEVTSVGFLSSGDGRIWRAGAPTTGYVNFGSTGTNYFGWDGSGFQINGAVTIGALLTVSGFGTHAFSASGTGNNVLKLENTSTVNGDGTILNFYAGSTTGQLYAFNQNQTASGFVQPGGIALANGTAGGISIIASHASGDVRIFAGGTGEDARFHASGGVSFGDTTDPGATNVRVAGTSTLVGALTAPTLDTGQGANELYDMDQNVLTTSSPTFNRVQATAQPGFLAYNSAEDFTQAAGATVDFDTELYDETGAFAADTFTAPVTGRYLLTTSVGTGSGSTSNDSRTVTIVTTGFTYYCSRTIVVAGGDENVSSCSVVAPMTAGDTAVVKLFGLSGTVTVRATSTVFSARLLS